MLIGEGKKSLFCVADTRRRKNFLRCPQIRRENINPGDREEEKLVTGKSDKLRGLERPHCNAGGMARDLFLAGDNQQPAPCFNLRFPSRPYIHNGFGVRGEGVWPLKYSVGAGGGGVYRVSGN